MLTNVKLTNFRKHRDTTVGFGAGLTVVRAPNEGAKTTLLEGVYYALFGVRALRSSLEETVTWGEDVKTLRAEAGLLVDGVAYTVKRGKSGAECLYPGGSVTGQNEVTNFVCRLLKVGDAAAASRLMLSGQGDIRGALEAGTKATTDLIERLSDFDQIDQLLARAEERLTLGATTTTTAAIEALTAQLDAARAAAGPQDQTALEQAVAGAQVLVDAAQRDEASAEQAAEAAQAALDQAREQDQARKLAQAAREAADREFHRIGAELRAARAVPAPGAELQAAVVAAEDVVAVAERELVDAEQAQTVAQGALDVERLKAEGLRSADLERDRRAQQLQQLRAEYDSRGGAAPEPVDVQAKELRAAQLRDVQALQRRYDSVKQFIGTADVGGVWDEPFDSLPVALKNSREAADALLRAAGAREQEAAKARQQAAVLRTKISVGSCGFCGQDFSEVEAVKIKNADLEAQAVDFDDAEHSLLEQAAQARSKAAEEQESARVLGLIHEVSRPAVQALEQFPDLLARQGTDLPPTVIWVGGEIPDAEAAGREVHEISRELTSYRSRLAAYEAAQARRSELAPQIAAAEESLAAGQEARRLLPQADAAGAQAALAAATARVRTARAAAKAANDASNQAKADAALASVNYDAAQARAETLNGQLTLAGYAAEASVQELGALAEADLAGALLAVEQARPAARQARDNLATARNVLRDAQAAQQSAIADHERALELVRRVEAALAERTAELSELTFNNALVKRIKQVRPLIADKLWNLVLAAVSQYFSEMRGAPSVVSKDGDGFKVDGRGIGTLSGSTLDILGLAIRVALVRTFLPTAPFLAMDEPFAACDDGRTGNMLGFLQACGFGQVILSTHEDMSESVADNVVELAS